MASGYKYKGDDFDDLFEPYVSGPKAANSGLRRSGVDLSNRYAPLSLGSKRANVGYRVGGVDVSNLWAAKGTVVYFPASIRAYSTSLTGIARSASATISIRTNGNIVVSTNGVSSSAGAGTYRYSDSSAAHDFRIFGGVTGARGSGAAASLSGKGGVNFNSAYPGSTASFDTGWQSSADDAGAFLVFTCSSPANVGSAQLHGEMTIQVRRKSDGAIVSSWVAGFDVISDSES